MQYAVTRQSKLRKGEKYVSHSYKGHVQEKFPNHIVKFKLVHLVTY